MPKVNKAPTQPNPSDTAKCFRLRCQSKQGFRLHSEDMTFLEKILELYPKWYSEQTIKIWEATAPFGAQIRKRKRDA